MSAGKLQRNPATGKLQRKPNGKLARNTATNTSCCCGGGTFYVLRLCDDNSLSPYTMSEADYLARGTAFNVFLRFADAICYYIAETTTTAGTAAGDGLWIDDCANCTTDCDGLALFYPDTYAVVENVWPACANCFAAPEQLGTPIPDGPGTLTRESVTNPAFGSADTWRHDAEDVGGCPTCDIFTELFCISASNGPPLGDSWKLLMACAGEPLDGCSPVSNIVIFTGYKFGNSIAGAAGVYVADPDACSNCSGFGTVTVV